MAARTVICGNRENVSVELQSAHACVGGAAYQAVVHAEGGAVRKDVDEVEPSRRSAALVAAYQAAAEIVVVDARASVHARAEIDGRALAYRDGLRRGTAAERVRGRAGDERRPAARNFRAARVGLAGLRRRERAAAFHDELHIASQGHGAVFCVAGHLHAEFGGNEPLLLEIFRHGDTLGVRQHAAEAYEFGQLLAAVPPADVAVVRDGVRLGIALHFTDGDDEAGVVGDFGQHVRLHRAVPHPREVRIRCAVLRAFAAVEMIRPEIWRCQPERILRLLYFRHEEHGSDVSQGVEGQVFLAAGGAEVHGGYAVGGVVETWIRAAADQILRDVRAFPRCPCLYEAVLYRQRIGRGSVKPEDGLAAHNLGHGNGSVERIRAGCYRAAAGESLHGEVVSGEIDRRAGVDGQDAVDRFICGQRVVRADCPVRSKRRQ